ncbi:MAG: alanine--tRNA ligase [Parachlamydiaceae bacterium]|nr:alanine--tRNA ligase [Parachlamydiaceae bacterium]
METNQVRRHFLEYFKKNNHAIISSSPVIPHDDPSLLFINAGMNQFKDVFLGESARDYTRAATSQKCIRVGGKHNDLENVGHTSRHLTFFEMLGNFSFGDYFKKEAIAFAWEVSTQVLGMDPTRIWPTVFREDEEAFELWTRYVPAERITRFNEDTNFWAMGDTGPCGPCSELLYDRGPAYGSARKPAEDPDGERFLEYWNLVFMQYNRSLTGILEPLPKPSIDTGAGLERVISLKMGVESVFETDVLRELIAQVENVSQIVYDIRDPSRSSAFRVIADHLRCLAFAIADGVQPSNVDRGYVLRKVLRRAVRYGRQLGMEEPFLAKILPRLIDTMGEDYREIVLAKDRIADILTSEEEAFLRTLRRGGSLLNQIIDKAQKQSHIISGDDAFKLKDTYGMPVDEILLLAKDSALTVDLERYQALELEAKERSRATQKTVQQFASENLFADFIKQGGECQFVGYSEHTSTSLVKALVVDGKLVDRMNAGQTGMVILDKTPFYAEMGGQIGDTGTLANEQSLFNVTACMAPYSGIIAQVGTLDKGELKVGSSVTASINVERRQKIANNHTATHLLHWALHKVLGEHIKQAGSVVDASRLRFDFSHHKALTLDEIDQIEELLNGRIRENRHVESYELSYDDAQKRSDIKQFFGEKYGSKVRVIDIDFSKELCGGTHVVQLGSIGLFKIAKESSIAAGVRRIEGVTGTDAEALYRQSEKHLLDLALVLKTQVPKLTERVEKLLEENKKLAQELKSAKKGTLDGVITNLAANVEEVSCIPLLVAKVELHGEELRVFADELSVKVPSGILVLAAASGESCQLLARVSDEFVGKGIKANEIIQAIAPFIGGTGGGKANSAQAGGKAPEGIPMALAKVKDFIISLSLEKKI